MTLHVSQLEREAQMAALQAAADAQDENAFLATYRTIDWEHSDARTFEIAIHLALAAGAHMAARRLAAQGAALHSESKRLQNVARALAPPRVLMRNLPAEEGPDTNRTWMLVNRDLYLGQWVALRNGELLGAAEQLKNLTARFGIVPEVLYTRVT